MGKFIGVIAASLQEQDNTFVQGTEVLEFPNPVWIYYCRPHLGPPPTGWLDLAENTLRVSSAEYMRHDLLEWEPLIIPQEESGVFEYTAEQFGVEPGNNLFHLALPPDFLPVAASWDIEPLYGHADGSRFVIGWGGHDSIWPALSFKRLEPADFISQARELERAIERASRARRQQVLNPWGQPAGLDTTTLRRRLNDRLNMAELKILVHDLGLDLDNLAGETKEGKLLELLDYMERQGQLSRLVDHLNLAYPHAMRP
jgi:hypothetical protein